MNDQKTRADRAMAQSEVTAAERACVLELVEIHGLRDAARQLELHPSTVQRILSPLPVRRQTAHWLRDHLREMRV